jgi:hypothetical protein
MNDCSWLSDRMPSIALRRAEWTADEVRHLNECTSCRAEWDLLQAGIRLGHASPPLRDPDELARALLERLAQGPQRSRRSVWTAASGLAAAAAVAATVWLGGRATPAAEPDESAPVVAGVHMPLQELESLQPDELESVLQTMNDSLPEDGVTDDPELTDLDSDELQQVLDTWEG